MLRPWPWTLLVKLVLFSCLESTVHIYNRKVETEGKPVTNQKSSGRCWLFACLNVARQPFAKQFSLEDFEFSQAHLFYWDKIERANYFLNNIGIAHLTFRILKFFKDCNENLKEHKNLSL